MKVVQLPRGMVWFLNELRLGVADLAESLEAFLLDREGARLWLESESAYSLHDEEHGTLENIAYLWSRVDALVEEGDRQRLLDELPPLLYEAALLMERVTGERERGHFSPLPAVNRVVLAGAAWIQGRGSREAAQERLAVLAEFARNLRRMYTRLRSDLPKEYRPDVDRGMRHLKGGIEAAEEALDVNDHDWLHDALQEICAGATLVQFLLDRDRREMELLAETYQRFNIPLIGPQLESELVAAGRAPRHSWSAPAETTLTVSLPELERHWEQVQSSVLLPPELRGSLLAAVDEAIVRLYRAYEAVLDPSCPDAEALRLLEDSMVEASEAFTAVQRASLTLPSPGQSLAHTYLEAVRGIMAGTVPDLTLAHMVSGDPPPGGPDVRRLLLEYLEGGHPDCLAQAMELMLESLPRSLDPGSELVCPLCGTRSSSGAQFCLACGARLGLIGQTLA